VRAPGAMLLSLLAAPALAATPACPPQLAVRQQALNLPDGARAFDISDRHPLISIQFSDGAPDERYWLAPSRQTRRGAFLTNIWEFTASDRPIWLSCGYAGTSIVVSFPLPASLRRCEVPFDTGFSPPVADRFTCQ